MSFTHLPKRKNIVSQNKKQNKRNPARENVVQNKVGLGPFPGPRETNEQKPRFFLDSLSLEGVVGLLFDSLGLLEHFGRVHRAALLGARLPAEHGHVQKDVGARRNEGRAGRDAALAVSVFLVKPNKKKKLLLLPFDSLTRSASRGESGPSRRVAW